MILVVMSPAASPPWFYRTENTASAKPSALLLLPRYLSHIPRKPIIALLTYCISTIVNPINTLTSNVRGAFKNAARAMIIAC